MYLIYENKKCNQVRLIFDRYVATSLKGKTREKMSKGIKVHFKVNDTIIQNVLIAR